MRLMMCPMSITRRSFLGAMTAAAWHRVPGANDRVQVGFIGYGLIGAQHVYDFKNQKDVDLAALCDVYRPRLEEGLAACGPLAKGYGDFRKLLEDRDVQAVVISTPDHWHALMTLMACAAGKDVYVEKPLTLFVREGRRMVRAAERHRRVVQVGTQQRSGPHYQRARELIQGGHLGKITSVRMQGYRNIMPGYGNPPDQDPPPELDWEMFLGPAPLRKYNPNRGLYHFRWFWDYSGGQMTNWGQHALDIVHWCLPVAGPRSVTSIGGRYSLQDNGETPDTQDAFMEYPGFTATWSHQEASRGSGSAYPLEFFGPKGSLAISRKGFLVSADRRVAPANTVPHFSGAHPVGGPALVQEADPPQYWTQPIKDESGDGRDQFQRHVRNFLDCVK